MAITHLLFIQALSPLHAGTGQGIGVIDMPIAREVATNLPYLPGSSIKGTLRNSGTLDSDNAKDKRIREAIFGPDTINAADYAGSVQFADARLLLLPVRSLAGTFAWVTSPYVLRRFARDARETNLGALTLPDAPDVSGDDELCLVTNTSALAVAGVGKVVLEDLDLVPQPDTELDTLATTLGSWLFPDGSTDAVYWRGALGQQLCVVRDDVLQFLLTTATEVFARVKLQDNQKTVEQGGLWYEEALPTETILAGLAVINPVAADKREKVDTTAIAEHLATLTKPALQFGGKATVGRGLCQVRLQGGAA